MTKSGYIHRFSELYLCVYLCKIAVSLAGQGIEGDCVFVYGYEYAIVYAFVRGYVNECRIWF